MEKTLVDLFELREDDSIDVEIDLDADARPPAKNPLKILTPTKPIRPWLSEER